MVTRFGIKLQIYFKRLFVPIFCGDNDENTEQIDMFRCCGLGKSV